MSQIAATSPPTASLNAPPTYLLDANILLRLVQVQHPHHAIVRAALSALRRQSVRLATAPQSLYEFWAVATRPTTAGGLGLSIEGATAYLNLFEREFSPLVEVPVYSLWRRLVLTYGVSGLNTHDARLMALALEHGITHLLTFNGADFRRYEVGEGITIVDPANMSATERLHNEGEIQLS